MRIALAQMAVTEDISENLSKLLAATERAAQARSHILLTPEGALSGYVHRFDGQAMEDALERLTAHARARSVGLALGTMRVERGVLYNQLRFYARDGAFLGAHAKLLRCADMRHIEDPDSEYRACADMPLRTFTFEGVTVGGLLCNDLWANPMCTPMPDAHLTRALARMGARVIFHAVNGGRDASAFSQQTCKQYHESNLRMRAMSDDVYIATVDNAHPVELANASIGGVVSPRGERVLTLPDVGEQFGVYDLTLGCVG